ncbi:DUF2237 family protein [Alteromonas lipotrueiana]|uniref:DUF2237 family protein n=1 Tax=Alteromonas lipotrueiana TaxID=2803815 RepID=UPI001C487A15
MGNAKNVYGKPLQLCCGNTGFTREGFCYTPIADKGNHSVCAIVDREFLEFTASYGNDLMTPRPDLSFSGLKPGDRWCLCASRWLEAYKAGVAPKVNLNATNIRALEIIPLPILEMFTSEPA